MNPLRTFINLILPLKLLLTRNVTQKYRTHSVAYTADQAVYLRPFPRRDINTTSAASRVTTARWPKTQQQLAQVIFDEVKLSRCTYSLRDVIPEVESGLRSRDCHFDDASVYIDQSAGLYSRYCSLSGL